MNRRLLDPFKSVGLPETIDEYLHCGTARCVAFNRRGTLLAAGTDEGEVVYWDVDTRGVARMDAGHSKAVVSVCWSRDGRFVISGSLDKTVVMWDVLKGQQVHSLALDEEVVQVSAKPDQPHICIVSLRQGLPLLVDLQQQKTQEAPSLLQGSDRQASTSSQAPASGFVAVAAFSKCGTRIFVGTSRGQLVVLDAAAMDIIDVIKVPGSARVVGLCLNRKGDLLLLNCQDKVIRLFAVAPAAPAATAPPNMACRPLPPEVAEKLLSQANGIRQGSLLGRGVVTAVREFSNAVEKVQWKGVCFSTDSEYVVGAAGTTNEHNMYIWNCHHGKLERILEGPKAEGVQTVAWHPLRSALLSMSSTGKVFVWTKIYEENWSAFAPDFQELEENQEYVEREDEFDQNDIQERVDETRRKRYKQVAEGDLEEEVDVVASDAVAMFSSDDEEDASQHLHYLPVVIQREPEEKAAEQWENGEAEEEEDAEEDERDGLSEPEQLVLNGPRKRKAKSWGGGDDTIWADPNEVVVPRRRKGGQ